MSETSWVRRSFPAIAAGITLVACTGTVTGARSAPTGPIRADSLALVPDAQRYAAIVAQIDVATASFEAQSALLPVNATVGDFMLIARPFADAVTRVDDELRQARWPVLALDDIKAELAADESLRVELTGTADDTLILGAWRRQVISSAQRASHSSRIVSTDLGLIAPPTGAKKP